MPRLKIKNKAQYAKYLESAHWKKTRLLALHHHGELCNRCGATSFLQVHHLNYNRVGFELMTDLEILCSFCHRLEHGQEDRDKKIPIKIGSEKKKLRKKKKGGRKQKVREWRKLHPHCELCKKNTPKAFELVCRKCAVNPPLSPQATYDRAMAMMGVKPYVPKVLHPRAVCGQSVKFSSSYKNHRPSDFHLIKKRQLSTNSFCDKTDG